MAKAANPHPHVVWRDGRPRFAPGPKLREAGHKGFDLRWPAPGEPGHNGFAIEDLAGPHENSGRWFTRGEAVDWSGALQRRLKQAARPAPRKRRKPAYAYTVMELLRDFQNPKLNMAMDPAYAEAIKPKTRAFYRQSANTIADVAPAVYGAYVAALDRPVCRKLFERIRRERGLATARGAIATLSAAIGWGQLTGKVRREDNPCSNLRMPVPAPRVRYGTRPEMLAMIAAADAEGLPEIGDAVMLGLWTGQRQADRLAAVHKGRWNGRRIFKQAKTGAIVAILEAPELETRLARSAERRRKAGVVDAHVLLDEAAWRPFGYKRYIGAFNRVRDRAIADGCATLADFWDMDLRDTAVTWLALAGATIPEIINVTGHTAQSATRILKHYLAQHPELADAAIRKMIDWYENDGETEIGL